MAEVVVVVCDNCGARGEKRKRDTRPDGLPAGPSDWYMPEGWRRGDVPDADITKPDHGVGDLCQDCDAAAHAASRAALRERQATPRSAGGAPGTAPGRTS